MTGRRVLFLAARLGPGGVTTHMVSLATELQAHGWSTAVASGGGSGTHHHGVEWLERQGLSHYPVRFPQVPDDLVRVPNTAWRCIRIAREFKPDVIHVHWRSTAWCAEIVRAVTGIPFVVTVHVEGIPGNWSRRLLSRWGDQVIAVSSDTRADVAARFALPAERIRVIPYGIDERYFRPPTDEEREQARRQFGVDPDVMVVALLGSGWRRKGHDVLIRAFAALKERRIPAVALLAGDEQDREFVARFSTEHGVADCIRFLGYQESRAVLWGADVLALPSRAEGLPIAVIEAMMCGVVPVRTPAGGASDQVIPGQTGLLFPFEDAAALASHLEWLCRDAEARRRLQRGALELARTRFTRRRMGEEVLEVYAQVSGRVGERPPRAEAVGS